MHISKIYAEPPSYFLLKGCEALRAIRRLGQGLLLAEPGVNNFCFSFFPEGITFGSILIELVAWPGLNAGPALHKPKARQARAQFAPKPAGFFVSLIRPN